MLVKIISYDPVKGLGWYETPGGYREKYRYNQLADQKMIPARKLAVLRQNKYLDPVKGVSWRLKWLYRRLIS